MIRRFSINFAIVSMLIDLIVIAGGLWLMAYFRPNLGNAVNIPFIREIRRPVQIPLILYGVFPVIWVFIMLFFSVYDGRKNLRVVDEFTSLTLSAALAGISLAGILYLSYRDISRLMFVTFVIITYLALLLWRIPARLLYQQRNRALGRVRRVLIIGAGNVGKEVEQELIKHPAHVQVIGFLDDDPAKCEQETNILGKLDEVREIITRHQVDDVVCALPLRAYERMNDVVWALNDAPVGIWIVPDYFQWTLHHAETEDFSGIPMLDVRAPALNENQRMVKRILDLSVAAVIILPLLFVMGIISLAILLDDGAPVLFRQKRVGENGRLFTIYKFRTMVKNAEQMQKMVEQVNEEGKILHKRPDDPRVTRVGRTLRRWSLDEFPQIFNIIRGTMSLVGPRPELLHLVEKYQPWQRKRFAVPPGITGWWQIHGRSDRPMHLHTEDDLYYIQNYSIWLDIQILIRTFWTAVRGKGAY